MAVVRSLARYPIIAATLVVLAVVAVIASAGGEQRARWIASAYVGLFIVWTLVRMVRDVLRGHIGLDVLAVVAMVATLAVGEYLASLIIVLMLSGGEALEDFAARRATRDLTALLDRSPRTAHVVVRQPGLSTAEDGDSPPAEAERITDVPVDEVAVGDILLVRPSEIVPVDGELQSETGTFDESSLTGESMPVVHGRGDEVFSGAINGAEAVRIRARRPSSQSQYQQIVSLVRQAQASRAPVVRLADRFAIPFTAVSLVLAGAAWTISGDPARFAEVLVLATPCPLLIAAPVAFLGGLSRAAKAGVIVKGGGVIERLARARSACFDKTGTLTAGRPDLVDVRPADGFDRRELLTLAATAEQYSTHVLADGVRRLAAVEGITLRPAEAATEVATNGVTALIDGAPVAVGKPAFIASRAPAFVRTHLVSGQAAAYVAVGDRFAGALVLADAVRPESAAVVDWLRGNGVERVAMLTGDAETTATAIASQVGITEVHAELLPPEKVHLAAAMQPRPTMMVGDGVNDAPVLAASDIGVAMGARGATAAGDAADVVVVVDSLAKVAEAVAISRHTLRVALTAIWIGITLSIGLMIVAMTGVIPAVAGALIQEGVDLATILYALRALRGPVPVIGATPDVTLPRSATPDRAPGAPA
ncbi:heavy metal translocating P-type ATPase [Microbacterium sp. AK009]|uniref:heavy metal translocating P-type ATPase n=1 Tax=Microbacterium sp. AK009 TaxID=2723068 RepID=UPI0015C9756B|nr:heavy metal translocating P-type ATPase [Microbacterium sp. AK009]